MPSEKLLTLGDISDLTGEQPHRVRYAIERDGIEERQRAGIIRLWSSEDVPRIRAALARNKGNVHAASRLA